ncbi:hypothetical protein C2845_PM10G11140 [Panicum miliaceum]|uniref:Uncharacterized protein n=1 Tax=Panicum miliaceum TaxID=4540 RepID=A0A3L6PDR0_PANMI|nr:hypothetical protein C2845_PM10G11140 [Panicum miliaceum]
MIGVPERKEGSTIIPSFPVLLEAWPCADEPSVVAQIPVTNGQSNTTPNDDNVNVGTGNENSVDADVLYGAFEQLNLDGEDMKRAVYQRHLEETGGPSSFYFVSLVQFHLIGFNVLHCDALQLKNLEWVLMCFRRLTRKLTLVLYTTSFLG